jgi:hypothetical protein
LGSAGRVAGLLEGVACGGLWIEAKTRRPHHEHRPGALRFLARLNGGRHVNALYQATALHCPLTDPLGFIKVTC